MGRTGPYNSQLNPGAEFHVTLFEASTGDTRPQASTNNVYWQPPADVDVTLITEKSLLLGKSMN